MKHEIFRRDRVYKNSALAAALTSLILATSSLEAILNEGQTPQWGLLGALIVTFIVVFLFFLTAYAVKAHFHSKCVN